MPYLYNFAPLILFTPIPMLVQFQAYICGRSLAGIEGSNRARGMDVLSLVSVVCCQVEDSVGQITHREKSYRVWCVGV
jgi:hypothetical protein